MRASYGETSIRPRLGKPYRSILYFVAGRGSAELLKLEFGGYGRREVCAFGVMELGVGRGGKFMQFGHRMEERDRG